MCHGRFDEARDSKGRVFHKACLKCAHCRKALVGEVVTLELPVGATGHASAQQLTQDVLAFYTQHKLKDKARTAPELVRSFVKDNRGDVPAARRALDAALKKTYFTGLPLPPPMKVYCGRHATKRDRDTSLHKAAKGRQAGRTHRHSIVRGEATVKEIQGEIGHKIAMRPPTCGGCGGAFDKAGEELKWIGMQPVERSPNAPEH